MLVSCLKSRQLVKFCVDFVLVFLVVLVDFLIGSFLTFSSLSLDACS